MISALEIINIVLKGKSQFIIKFFFRFQKKTKQIEKWVVI